MIQMKKVINKPKETYMYPRQDIFLWLKSPTIAQMKEVLRWAHKRALRADIVYSNSGEVKHYPSEMDFESILEHVDRTAKLFFRIIVR